MARMRVRRPVFWVFVLTDGESWQGLGSLQECIAQFMLGGHDLKDVIAIVSH